VNRQGVKRWRLRAPHLPTVTIKGDYGSAEFADNYRAAIEGEPAEKKVIGKHGTIGALARSYLRSAAFAQLAPTTQKARRYLIDRFGTKYDTLPVARTQASTRQVNDGRSCRYTWGGAQRAVDRAIERTLTYPRTEQSYPREKKA
jgi:hypothetical protein